MNAERLRLVLRLDAVTSLVSGVAFVALAGVVAAPLGLPAWLFRELGVALLPFGALMAWGARAERPDLRLVAFVVACDLAWVVGSVYALVDLPLTTLGKVAVVAVACMVEAYAGAKLYYAFRSTDRLVPVRG